MKQIKFRFWSKLLNHWVIPNDDIFVGALKDDDMVVLQYTGLKDIEGKEIYEGDILEVDWHDSRYPIHNIGPVEWDQRNACWSLGEGGTAEDDAKHNMRVIGNIYENKDLIK